MNNIYELMSVELRTQKIETLSRVKREAIRLGGLRGYDGPMVASGIVEFIDRLINLNNKDLEDEIK